LKQKEFRVVVLHSGDILSNSAEAVVFKAVFKKIIFPHLKVDLD